MSGKYSTWLLVCVCLLVSQGAVHGRPRLATTYSIVARDPQTGRMGVAVQSHWFSVGSVVPWGRAGVGVVATQSLVRVDYGPKGLALMGQGLAPQQALDALVTIDEGREVRQVAMLDAKGRVAAHTGRRCIASAGHFEGEQYAVQANMMVDETIVPAMKQAFESSEGDLAERMLAALEAAQKAGGDIRGKQSAAMIIVSGTRTPEPWQGRMLDIRVEDHAAPLAELRRLVTIHRAYEHSNAGDEHLGKNEVKAAMREYAAAARLAPQITELRFWQAVTLLNTGKEDEAAAILKPIFEKEPFWADLLPRLQPAGLLKVDDATLKRMQNLAPRMRNKGG